MQPSSIASRRRSRAFLAAFALASWAAAAPAAPPATLAETGLYADFERRVLAPEVLAFEPQYPLWSDGARKRRWILLPPDTAIDASDPDLWRFPAGTRFWKEFGFERPVETRYMELGVDGRWSFATYLWSADGTTATLAPARGARRAAESAPGVPYDVPGVADCRACHGGHPATVLGFSALQLSPDRDPRAPHAGLPSPDAVDLTALVARGLVTGLPQPIAAHAPRVRAATAEGRAALGYLHGNCASCHNARGPLAELGLSLEVRADGEPEALTTAVAQVARYRPAGAAEALRVAPGDPAASLLVRRLGSRQPLVQMPPMSTHAVDEEALALVVEWIRRELAAPGTSHSVLAAGNAALPKEKQP
jgi:mono/diheme cytochrome c family protein